MHLQSVKIAVFVGKDRQSDYLSYMTTSKAIQSGLRIAEDYTCTRTPETFLKYVENAKKYQKKLMFPTGIVCNGNGEPFILDAGSASVLALTRSSVAKMFVIGTYMKPSLVKYKSNETALKIQKVNLSNNLSDIALLNNNLFIVDAGRGEVIVVPNVSVASNIPSRSAYVIQKFNVTSVAFWKEHLVCLCNDTLEILKFKFPKKAKNEPLFIDTQVIKKIKLPCEAKYIFSLHEIDVIGICSSEKEIVLCCNVKQSASSKVFFKSLSIFSAIRPVVDGCTITYQPPSSKNTKQLDVVSGKTSTDISTFHSMSSKDLPDHVQFFTKWGHTCFFVVKSDGGYKVKEHGSLSFGLRLSQCLNKFYDAISYIPPHGFESARKLTLADCIALASDLAEVLNEAQADCKNRFPNLNSFNVAHGAVATDTLYCLNATINSWKSLCSRLDYFDPGLKDQVVPFTVTNESIVERSFGFTVKKGQSPLQTMQEYIYNKKKHVTDFLIKMCDCPFNQDIKIKLRDKGYQHVHETMISKISVNDLWEVFNATSNSSHTTGSSESDVSEERNPLLYHAFLLTKSVPRKSNRAKWKEESGFAPNMLQEHNDDGKLLKGDMVLAKNLDSTLAKLVVQADCFLKDVGAVVSVLDAENDTPLSVKIERLIKDKGLIAVIPSNMFSIEENMVTFADAVQEMVLDLDPDNNELMYCDEELLQLPELQEQALTIDEPVSGVPAVNLVLPPRNNAVESQSLNSLEEEPGPSGVSSKRTLCPDEDEDEDDLVTVKKNKKSQRQPISSSDDEDDEMCFLMNNISKGDWVVVGYDNLPYVGTVVNIDACHGFQVHTLDNCGNSNSFKWSADSIWYKEILLTIDEPNPANNRGALKLSDADYDKYKNLF